MTATQTRYPREVEIRDGSVVLRPLEAADQERMLTFAKALPSHDLLFLRRDITQPREVEAWIGALSGNDLHSIVALEGDAIVGYCVVDRSPLAWMRHVAELRVMVAQEMRGRGLGRVLVTEAFRIASEIGVEKMVAQMTTDQRTAIVAFQNLGFANEAVLPGHVKDRDGKVYDLLVLGREVSAFEASVILEEMGEQ